LELTYLGMNNPLRPANALLLCLLVFLLSPFVASAQEPNVKISTTEQIKTDLERVTCKDEERLSAVKALFQSAGAANSDLTINKYKDVEDVVLIKKGETDEKIVVGAHYDKVSLGCGAIDNWTGIVTLANLYSSIKNSRPKKTLIFVAFGKEERGLVGSHAMATAIDKNEIPQYCAMINIDSLGLSAPQVADNMSSRKMTELAAGVAKAMNVPFSHASIPGGDSDSSSFKDRKIPSVTIHGLSNDWPKILHSRNDQVSKINPTSVYLGYRLALAIIARVDQASCAEYR
jgi:hypothetical protein